MRRRRPSAISDCLQRGRPGPIPFGSPQFEEAGQEAAREAVERLARQFPGSTPAELQANVDRDFRDEFMQAGVTERQSRGIADVFDSRARRVRSVIRMEDDSIIGTIHSGDGNAMTLLVPDTEARIVVFDDSVVGVVGDLSDLIASMLSPRADQAQLDLSPEGFLRMFASGGDTAFQRFRQMIWTRSQSILYEGTPLELDTVQQLISYKMQDALLLFVTGHELGHVVYRHSAEFAPRMLPDGRTVTAAEWSWRQEWDSDVFSLEALHEVFSRERDNDIRLAVAAVDAYFQLHSIVERAQAILATGHEPDPTKFARDSPTTRAAS